MPGRPPQQRQRHGFVDDQPVRVDRGLIAEAEFIRQGTVKLALADKPEQSSSAWKQVPLLARHGEQPRRLHRSDSERRRSSGSHSMSSGIQIEEERQGAIESAGLSRLASRSCPKRHGIQKRHTLQQEAAQPAPWPRPPRNHTRTIAAPRHVAYVQSPDNQL